MSNRTIVEFNHDLAGEIDRDPEGFLRAIKEMLRAGVAEHEGRSRNALTRFGVRTSPTHHHSTQAEVVLTHNGIGEFSRVRFS